MLLGRVARSPRVFQSTWRCQTLTRRASSAASRRTRSPAATKRSPSSPPTTTWQPPDWFEQRRRRAGRADSTRSTSAASSASWPTPAFSICGWSSRCSFDDWQIIGIAHYTQHIFDGRDCSTRSTAAVADRHLVLGLIGKHQRVERNALGLPRRVDQRRGGAQTGQQVAIVFGREDFGLSNAMLDAATASRRSRPTLATRRSTWPRRRCCSCTSCSSARAASSSTFVRRAERAAGAVALARRPVCRPRAGAGRDRVPEVTGPTPCARCAWPCTEPDWIRARQV